MAEKLKPGWLFLRPADEAATTLWEGLLPLTRQLRGRILDAGCGNGDYTLRLREISGVTEVVSVDIVPLDTVLWGRRFCDNVPGGIYIQADIQNLDMFQNNFFDGILAWHVIEHCKEPRNALREFARVLKGEGRVFVAMPVAANTNIDTYNREFKGTPQEHYVSWNPEDLECEARVAGLEPVTPVYIDWMGGQDRLFGILE